MYIKLSCTLNVYCQRLHSNFTFHFFYLKEIFGGGGGLHVYMFSIIHTKKFEKTQTSAIYTSIGCLTFRND